MTKKKIKSGSYSAAFSAAAIAVVILINMIVAKVPSVYTKWDVSDQQLFTVGEQTKELVKNLEQDVEIYMIAQEGAHDATLQELLLRYDALSDHITMEMKDPVLYPEFTKQYTDVNLADNSVIVVSGERAKAIDYYDLYTFETDYYSYTSTMTEFDGEGQVTSAIAYVTSEEIPVLYTIEGHQEMAMSDSLKSAIEKENIEVKSLNLLTSEQVPEDAQILFLYGPQVDLSEEETGKLRTYLQAGGHMLWITAYAGDETPNLDALLEEYGLIKEEGLVVEENSNYHLPNYAQYLLPQVKQTEMTANLTGRHVLFPLAQGLKEATEVRDTLTITELLSTSTAAYSKVDVAGGTLEKAEGDVDGPFLLGAAVTEPVTIEENESAETRLSVFSAEYLLEEQMDAIVSGGNTQLIMDSISWMSDHEVTISIAAKSLETDYLTVTAGSSVFWGILTTLALPLCLLVGGGIICYGRRKK